MCGIAGIFNPKGIITDEIKTVSKVLRHRGPDDEGFYLLLRGNLSNEYRGEETIEELSDMPHISEVQESPILALIHRRLSIIDITKQGHQPLVSETDRFSMIFNGEVYNYKEIRKELISMGFHFKSNSDTEVVLNAFIQWGEKCVEKFVGMWAFAIYDKLNQTITLSRDRFGIKPLYFYRRNSFFAFASEIKALLKLSEVDPRISNENVGSFLCYSTTSSPYQNLFSYIEDAEPGCNYVYNLKSSIVTKTPYYNLSEAIPQSTSTLNENMEMFESYFDDSIALHLRSDVEIGSCLSGGLDSSAIVYKASKQLGDVCLKTFTASYKNTTIDESKYAKMVAKELDNVEDNYLYPDSKTMVADLSKMLYHQDLPIGSTSIFAQWEVMKSANQHKVKVLLDGQGADETLGGYTNFAGIYLIELLKKGRFGHFMSDYLKLKDNFNPKIREALLKGAFYYLPQKFQRQLRAKERLSFRFINTDSINELNLDGPLRGGKSFKEHSELNIKFGMYDLLRYEDRNSMAFSIESRVPFLDHRLVELIHSLPSHHKIHHGWSKYPLRKMLNNKLDNQVVWRKDKKGFVTPQQDWKNELMLNLKLELKDSDIPSIMDRDYIIQLCDREILNSAHLTEFWRAYSLVKWYNIFNLKA